MIRNSVVLPDPDGPSSATSSPVSTRRSTLSSALKAPNCLTILRTSIVTALLSFHDLTFENRLGDQRDQSQQGQQGSDRKRPDRLIFVVENLDQQRHGIGLAPNVARDHGYRAEFAHR